MNYQKIFSEQAFRHRLSSVAMSLALWVILPSPSWGLDSVEKIFLLMVWILVGVVSFSLWYWPSSAGIFWFMGFLVNFILWSRSGGADLLSSLVLWLVLFMWMKRSPLEILPREKTKKILGLIPLFLLSSFVNAQEKSESKTSIPVVAPLSLNIKRGFKLAEMGSCARTVDGVAWKPAPEHRHTRILMADNLQLGTEDKPSHWEFHQIMDKDGLVSFVFRRNIENNMTESIITRDTQFSRVVDTKNGKKVIEKGDLSGFINRSYFIFHHTDGSTVSFQPGLQGHSSLVVRLSSNGGRYLAPLVIEGTVCSRLDDSEKDNMPKQPEGVDYSAPGGNDKKKGKYGF